MSLVNDLLMEQEEQFLVKIIRLDEALGTGQYGMANAMLEDMIGNILMFQPSFSVLELFVLWRTIAGYQNFLSNAAWVKKQLAGYKSDIPALQDLLQRFV